MHKYIYDIFYAGEVVEGMEHVREIEALGSSKGAMYKRITIVECGTV